MIPQLRFPEFTDEWQVKKLGDVVDFKNGKPFEDFVHNDGKYNLITIDSVDIKGNLKSKFKKVTKNDSSLKKGDIVTVLSDIAHGMLLGLTATIPENEMYVLNQRMGRLRPKHNDRPNFLSQAINLKQIFFRKRGQGTSQRHIYERDIAQLELTLPTESEQEKIADFLTAVDERIGVSEKKLELLETYKRGVMQKIFNQQIRFKDENGNPYPDWEEKKLSDVLKERNTQAPISGEYPLMAFVAYKGVAPKGDRYNREFLVSDAKSKKYKQTQLGDFIYSSNNLETGSIGLNLFGSASISPVYSIFETKDGYSHQFLGAYLTRKKFIYQMVRYRQGVVYGQWRIHESEFLKIEEKFPCTDEQRKIADFLATLDEKITTEKSKLTAAKQWKKGLLQRMFV